MPSQQRDLHGALVCEDHDEQEYVLSAIRSCSAIYRSYPIRAEEAAIDKGFAEALLKFDAAQHDLVDGNAETTKAIWSHGDGITLSGGFGGRPEKGWEQIGPRLDWVPARIFRMALTDLRTICCSSHLAIWSYVVQIEHISYQVPGQPTLSTRDYRVTMIFHREADGWRLIHRQADTQLIKKAPD